MDGINNEILCFMVVKRSWKGRYRRLLAIGPNGYSTYNPANLHLTNHWVHSDVIALKPCVRGIGRPDEFSLMVRIRSKPETFRFCSEETVEILTDILRVKRSLSEFEIDKNDQWEARKVHWSGSIVPIALEASTYGLLQLNKVSGEILAEYSYKDILCIYLVSDVADAFIICCSPYRRLHMFRCADVEKLIKRVEERSMENIGIACKVNANSVVESFYKQNRLGLHNIASHLTSIVEFNVTKFLARHPEPVQRLLCLSEACLIERDVSTYNVVTLKPLTNIASLIRCDKDPHLFYIEYSSGRCGVYMSVERDDLLASILDGVRAAGNVNVHVGMRRKNLALRWAPSGVPVDTESKLTLMKFITSSGMSREEFLETLRRFNSNIPYGGSFLSSFKEKQIVNCILAIVDINTSDLDPVDWEEVFQALRRLFASKVGFHAFTAVAKLRDKLGNLIVSALKLHNSAVSFAAVEVLCSLMQPLHDGFELRQEQANKSSLLSSPTFLEYLLDMMLTHVQQNTGTLVVAGMLDFLTYALCAPYSETTLPEQFDCLLQMVAKRGRILYRLFQSPSLTIVKSAGLVMRAIIEEAEAQLSSEMQEFALSEGAYLRHLYFSLFTVSSDIRMMAIRQLSRRLIALWTAGSFFAIDLLKRILPEGLMQYLKSNEELPLMEEDLLATRGNLDVVQKEKTAKFDRKNVLKEQLVALHSTVEKQVDSLLENWLFPKRFGIRKTEDATMPPVALRKRRIRVTVSENWNMLFHMFNKNHYQSNLIWNPKTRDDLKVALESEIHAFDASQAIQTDCHISWNHFDFEVIYSSLKDEIRIDNNYLRVFIEEHDANNVSKSLTNPKNFFNEVYHGYLTGANQQMRCLCLKALSVTYSDYFAQVGTFSDTKHFVLMLQNCCDLAERDALIDVIGKLCHFKENVKQIIMAGGVELLVDMISLAHLSVGKTSIGFEQSNIIQSSETMKRDDSKEWYCLKEGDSEKCGPYSFHHMKKLYKYGEIGKNTKIWGSGMDDWKPLESVAQFRWTLVASGTAQMNETKLAVKILDILLRMIDYFPSRDLEGCIIRPPSKVKQILASSSCLPHIVQLFLTFDPDIVARTAKLLKALIQDSPMISKLYLTGLYYFALMYSGSNIMPIAELFHCSHKMQAFCSVKNGDTVAKRSILYSLLPEAAIFCLENYGAEKYAEIFLSEFDNPEVIWNSEMRRYLIGKIAAHVCDFTVRLPSNVKALYHYCPLPKINYAQLENEMFCHIYYLRNLCDRDRFPNWTIVNPVEFLQSCLIAWKEEVKKKAPPMSIAEACEILELNYEDVSNNLSVVRKAYYKLAQKYHPDKNPHGREQFEKLNSAYELLASSPCNLSNTDSTVQRIVLCMRAQTLAFQIHTPIFEQYKYSGYQLLIRIIQMESEDEALFSKDGILLIRATELCCSTVECAPLNVEQLRRDNGLEHLLKLCCSVVRCISLMCESEIMQDIFFESGIMYNLISNLFLYDCTLNSSEIQLDTEINLQILKFVNSNIETPCFIWNGAMKVELFDYIASAEVALRSGHINSFCRKLLDFIDLELHCVDVLEFLLPLLIAPRTVGFYRQFMDIFISMVGNEQCLHSIVMIPKWYVPFIQLCDQQFNSCFQVLDMFQSLASINDAVDQLLKSGCGIYFLMLFSSSQIELEVRCKVTQLLAKLQTNRLHGPRWQRFISKLLPPIFTMYMKDSAAFAVTAFDFDSQNPELVWNSKLRSHAQKVIENLTVEFLDSFADADPAEQWTIPPDVQFDCTKLLPDECVVGGISIRLFVTNPSWPLRNSKQFLIDLFAAFLSDVQNVDTDDSVVEHLQLVTKAMTLFLHVHADLCDYICVEKFGETDCMRLFYAALQNYPDMRHLTSQNLKTLLLMGNEVLLAKAVNCQLHRLLLELLGSDLPEVDDPLATKAEIVTALNTLAASNTTFGNEVNAMLNRSAIWNDYRGQNHDLFITQPTEMNFLTDADRSNASLTYQENPKNINEPPPPAAL
ncbi:DnaJ -like protein subfamily C member 13 [Trichinella nelsoni]|uniref:DnaJ-like protein subfamily C member 13 n=1 Tax=Trichinella nelsoni TaxID=6336 RepID=A0A0V0RWC8_9BILA|nr:DnaJ -like protein subfamily C member 13 [Trichinella nelsoni]